MQKKSGWVTEQNFVHVLFPVCVILSGISTSGVLRARFYFARVG